MLAKAVVAVDKNKVEIREIEIGSAGEWEVVVELEVSAISVGTESYVLSHPEKFARLYIPGYAPIGRVVHLGEKAASMFKLGERISYFQPRKPPLTEQNCGGHQSPAIIEVNPDRRDFLASNTYCVKVPEGLSSERAVFGGISSISSLGVSLAEPKVGDKVLVIGQGLIGQFAAQHFKLRGAEVAVADLHEKRLSLSKESGADHLINARRQNVTETIRDLWPEGADIIADATGSYRVVEESVGAIRREGKYLFLAWYKGADFNLESFHSKVFKAYFPWTLKGDHVLASWRLMETGALKIDHLNTHSFAVEDAQKAYDLIYHSPAEYVGITLDWRK